MVEKVRYVFWVKRELPEQPRDPYPCTVQDLIALQWPAQPEVTWEVYCKLAKNLAIADFTRLYELAQRASEATSYYRSLDIRLLAGIETLGHTGPFFFTWDQGLTAFDLQYLLSRHETAGTAIRSIGAGAYWPMMAKTADLLNNGFGRTKVRTPAELLVELEGSKFK
jgi:hypothetical protein